MRERASGMRTRAARSRKLAATWLAALGAVAASTFSLMSSAWAAAPDNDGITPTTNYQEHCAAGLASDTVCQTDNSSVYYYMDSNGEYELEEEDRAIVRDAVARFRNNTILTITYDSDPDFSGAGETDVIYQEGAFGLPDAVLGVTWCNDPVDGATWRCDQTYIRMRGNGVINPYVSTHETGHSVGLLHGNRWAPVRDLCADLIGVMAAAQSCGSGAALGEAVRNNVNWVYQ